jgi:hypothetical protein
MNDRPFFREPLSEIDFRAWAGAGESPNQRTNAPIQALHDGQTMYSDMLVLSDNKGIQQSPFFPRWLFFFF